jgi:hypothetical protein
MGTAAALHCPELPLSLVGREGESLNGLLKRLDKAIARYYENGETTDEVNSP